MVLKKRPIESEPGPDSYVPALVSVSRHIPYNAPIMLLEKSMSEAPNEQTTELRGEAKKEAFHREAESKIVNFAFVRPNEHIPDGNKMHVKLAGTNTCQASVQILVK